MPTHLQSLFAKAPNPSKDEVVGAFPFSKSGGGDKHPKKVSTFMASTDREAYRGTSNGGDSGSAARFFYSAKASRADRAGSKHPTVKPIALMEWLATLITPPGGTILDPFAGSGTTGAAAARGGFNVILCERENEYVEDIKRRFDASVAMVTLPTSLTRLLQWNAAITSCRTKTVAA